MWRNIYFNVKCQNTLKVYSSNDCEHMKVCFVQLGDENLHAVAHWFPLAKVQSVLSGPLFHYCWF